VSADEPLGSAAQEAARLVEALQQWARDASADHLATGAAECTVCPLCRLVAALRDADPDTTAQVVETAVGAVSSAVALVEPAVRAVVEAAVAGAHAASEATRSHGSDADDPSSDATADPASAAKPRTDSPTVQHIEVE
jgi:hypothetical protein